VGQLRVTVSSVVEVTHLSGEIRRPDKDTIRWSIHLRGILPVAKPLSRLTNLPTAEAALPYLASLQSRELAPLILIRECEAIALALHGRAGGDRNP